MLATSGNGKEITTIKTTTTRTNGRKWLGFKLLGQLTRVSMLETYPTVVSVLVITMDLARPLSITVEGQAKWPKTAEPLPKQQTRETKTTEETYLPALVVDKKSIIGMNVQK
ncbi:hypothetical protein Tco_0699708 [Tanacetum coccineum]